MSDKEIMGEGVPVASTSKLPTDTSPSCADASSSTELLPECEPHQSRVPRPSRATIPSLTTTTTTAPISPAPSSPPLPVRSPLRPLARSISSPSSDVSPRSSIAPSIDLSATPGDTTPPDSAVSDLDLSASPQTPADATAILAMNIYDTRQRHGSLPSLSGLMDQVREEFGIIENEEDATPPLRVKPTSSAPLELFKGYSTLGPIPLPLATEEAKSEKEQEEDREVEDAIDRGRVSSSSTLNSVASNPSLTASSVSMMSTPASSIEFHEAESLSPSTATTTMTMTKRHHAMHELLSSERAYASDLALIREVHIPLALGQIVPLPHNIPSPPALSSASASGIHSSSGSSGDSSRAVSTASSESLNAIQPPMTPDDAKIIFSNVSELAIFADLFTEELELALGDVVEGGQGEDFVGALFLRIIPDLEKPYKHYITRHPTALQHLQALPQTPALQAYLTYTQTVASTVSHAWDLSSLLIKPVQRLLKYPLLLAAISDETPDSHPDKENLKLARTKIEEIARNVNEGRRRAEVVKDVLANKTSKKTSTPVGVAASVNLSKVKSLRHGGVTAATMRVSQLTEGSASEAAQVDAMQSELKRIEVFAQQFAKNIVDWGKMTANVMLALRGWALSFGKVIGLTPDQNSEAFEAFLSVVTQGLLPLTADLDAAINERLLKDMAHLLMTMSQPLKLLASMAEQEPYHYHLLTMPVSQKNRPPPALLAASTNYLALRGQLATELPTYLALLHRGCAVFVRRLADIQTRFWRDVKERWAELWEMLRVEEELNAGWEETCMVWCARWADVDEVVRALGITSPVPVHVVPVVAQAQAQANMQANMGRGYATLQAQHLQMLEKERERERQHMGKRYDSYFAYPDFYAPMAPQLSTVKEREREKLEKEQKEREREQKARDKEQREREKLYERTSKGKPNAAVVSSLFSALEPAHSPAHKKQAAMAVATNLAALNPPHTPSSSGTSLYSVSGPMPLGSMTSVTRDSRDSSSRRGRGRGTSDASTLASTSRSSGSGNTGSSANSSYRPPSQDSARQPPEARTPPARRRTHGHGLSQDFEEYMSISSGSIPPSYEGGQYPYSTPPSNGRTNPLGRRKSMPLAHHSSVDQASVLTNTTIQTLSQAPQLPNGAGYAVDGDRVYYQPPIDEWEQYQLQQGISPSRSKEKEKRPDRDRGRTSLSHPQSMPTMSAPAASPKAKSKERPTHTRKRSGSTKSITSFFTGGSSDRNSNSAPPDPQPLTASQRDSWVSKPAKYVCQVIHPCRPPASVQYYSFPFFTLVVGDLYQVLQEAGHPSIHPKLPLYVDDGEDCLLLCRDGNGIVGWALASFLEPVTMSV